MKNHSLKSHLKWLLISSTLLVSLVATLVVSLISHIEIKDVQDENLVHIASIVNEKTIIEKRQLHQIHPTSDCEPTLSQEIAEFIENLKEIFYRSEYQSSFIDQCEDFTDTEIVIEELSDAPSETLSITRSISQGFHTLSSKRTSAESWRVFVTKKKDKKYAVAQKTTVRSELVLETTLSSAASIFFFSIILLLAINKIVSYLFIPLKRVSSSLDQQTPGLLKPIQPEKNIEEVTPFVDAINRLITKINKHSQMEKRFISDASHELRTPISAIYLQFENLENAKTEEEWKKRITDLRAGIEQVKRLLEQLLDLSKIQNVGLKKEKIVSLDSIIKETVTLLYPLAEAKKIDLGVNQDESSSPISINHAVSQILANAISNAIRHTPENGIIDISIKQKADCFDLIVEDSGPGIPQEEIHHVLNAFYSANTNENSGAGLGLTIANEIAKKLGGSIELTQSSRGGLKFIYSQPIS